MSRTAVWLKAFVSLTCVTPATPWNWRASITMRGRTSCFLDIRASPDRRETAIEMVSSIANEVFIPFTVGGGIRSPDDVRQMLESGADKVSINTAAVENGDLVGSRRSASARSALWWRLTLSGWAMGGGRYTLTAGWRRKAGGAGCCRMGDPLRGDGRRGAAGYGNGRGRHAGGVRYRAIALLWNLASTPGVRLPLPNPCPSSSCSGRTSPAPP